MSQIEIIALIFSLIIISPFIILGVTEMCLNIFSNCIDYFKEIKNKLKS